MKRGMKAVVLVAALALCTGPLAAEESACRFELSPMVGWHMFEGNQNLDDGGTLGLTVGFPVNSQCTLEAGFTWISAEKESDGADVDGQRYGIDGLYHFRPDETLRPFILVGVGALTLDPAGEGSETDVMVNYGAGLKYALMPNLDLRAELRHVMPFDDFYNNLAAQVGVTWCFGKRERAEPVMAMDSDGDGVPDDMDACADTPMGVAVDEVGCPVVMDADGDGVSDDADNCPETPAGVAVDEGGCPLDSDTDGVPDHADNCPDTPVGVAVDEGGCPLDSDNDGVPDHVDACPETPDGQPVDEMGCPVVMDADGDGVEDDKDSCPDTPRGARTDDRGCWVLQGLSFDPGKTDLKSENLPLLKEVVAVLKANPGVRVAIEGHTDSQGSEAVNQRVSEARAKSVYDYFVGVGIEKERLEYKGFGETNPVADNATAEGRAKNRRVELRPL